MGEKKIKIKLKHYQYPDRFGEWLGYEVAKYDENQGTVETYLKIREDHLSPAGRVHGGVISAFFDFSCGAAVFTTMNPEDLCATIELKVNYLQPISLGHEIRAYTSVVFRGKRSCVVQSHLYKVGEKDASAMATATFHIVPARKPN